MLVDKKLIQEWRDQYGIKNYTINDDMTVNVIGDVDLSYKKIEALEVQFKHVQGSF